VGYEYPSRDRRTYCKTERKRAQKGEQGKLRGGAVDDHFEEMLRVENEKSQRQRKA
jgi:hypothetical protein